MTNIDLLKPKKKINKLSQRNLNVQDFQCSKKEKEFTEKKFLSERKVKPIKNSFKWNTKDLVYKFSYDSEPVKCNEE